MKIDLIQVIFLKTNMKKIIFILAFVLLGLASCNETKHTEGEEESVHTPGTAAIDAIEELSKIDADTIKADSVKR